MTVKLTALNSLDGYSCVCFRCNSHKTVIVFCIQLPEPLLTFDLYNDFVAMGKRIQNLSEREPTADTNDAMDIIQNTQNLLQRLPPYCYSTLQHLMSHLQRSAHLVATVIHSWNICHFQHSLALTDLFCVLTEFQRMSRIRCPRVTWALCLARHYCAPCCLPTCQCLLCWRRVTKLCSLSFSSHTVTRFLALSKDQELPRHRSPLHLFQTPLPEPPVL